MLLRRASFAIPALLTPLLFTQCKTETNDEGSGLTRQKFIEQYCQLANSCCVGAGYSSDGCAGGFGSVVPTSFDAASGQACLDAVRGNSSRGHFCTKGLFLSDVPACKVLSPRGNVVVGAECRDAVTGVECAPSPQGHVACVFGQGKSICQLTEVGSEGSDCVGDSNDDGTPPSGTSVDVAVGEKGTYCNRAEGLHCVSQKCTKLVPIGAVCTDSESCALGAYCPFDTKVCKAVAANGTPCKGDVECASKHCAPGSKQCSSVGDTVFLQMLCQG